MVSSSFIFFQEMLILSGKNFNLPKTGFRKVGTGWYKKCFLFHLTNCYIISNKYNKIKSSRCIFWVGFFLWKSTICYSIITLLQLVTFAYSFHSKCHGGPWPETTTYQIVFLNVQQELFMSSGYRIWFWDCHLGAEIFFCFCQLWSEFLLSCKKTF